MPIKSGLTQDLFFQPIRIGLDAFLRVGNTEAFWNTASVDLLVFMFVGNGFRPVT
jgi:hypothetical protein